MRGCVISDLHYLSRRSVFEQHRQHCLSTFSDMDVVVLNGDIFDFRWSTYRSLSESIAVAIRFLEQWFTAAPQARFYYVLGNHDSHPLFVQALQELSRSLATFEIAEHELQIGPNLFIHGDILHAKTIERLLEYRTKFHDETSWRPLDGVYQLAHHSRIAALFGRVQSATTRAMALEMLIERGEIPIRGTVSNVYYGHTHALSTEIDINGRRYHNTGAMILGIPWKILHFEVTYE